MPQCDAGSYCVGVPPPPTDRQAPTDIAIHPDIAARWSPRAFDPKHELSRDDLIALLESARWAATWGRRQPVRFVAGRRSDPVFAALAGLLRRGNAYAHAASALVLVTADTGDDDKTARYSLVDAGAAAANLSIEAVSRGLVTHPMAGFDVDATPETLQLPAGLVPVMIIAVGRLGDYRDVAHEIAERDSAPRERLPLADVVLNWPL